MNRILNWFGAKRNALVLSGLLIVFVVGLYNINSLFERETETRLVILPEKRNSGTLIASPNTSFRIESATKQRNNFPMYDFFAADANTVLLNRMQSSFTGIKLSMLYMDDNEVTDIATNTGYGVEFTPDRQNAVFTRYGSGENDYHVYAYDWKNKKTKKLGQDESYTREFITNNTYVGFDEINMKEVDLTTGKGRNLLSLEEMLSRISKLIGNTNKSEMMPILDSLTIDSKNDMYMIVHVDEENEQLYRLSLQDNNSNEVFAQMQLIQQFTLLSNGDFILLGNLNNTYGLYLYEKHNEQFKLLKKGNILGYDFDPQSSRLAYLQMLDNQKGSNELHVVYVKEGALHSDTVIYRNIQDFVKMSWLEDNLFVGGSSMDTSELYRFTFRVW